VFHGRDISGFDCRTEDEGWEAGTRARSAML
jgi:hypothetical protein